MIRVLALIITTVGVLASSAQIKHSADISAVAAAGDVTDGGYTNSYLNLRVDAPNATLQLNPIVNVKGQYARLLQVEAKPSTWEQTFTLSVSADSLTVNPQVTSAVQYVRSVRHQLEREGLPTVREEFPITIAGVQFTGAVLEQQAQGRKYYRGIYATFRNSYVVTLDATAPSPEQLDKLVTRTVTFTK
jgi:hypothetical protein